MAMYNRKHGLSKSREYAVWNAMHTRCSNPNDRGYPNYGGRGIEVCPRWRSFGNFIADMGRRPAGGTIERIDNDGPYSPQNCRWATRKEQASNKRNNRLLMHDDRTQTMEEWAHELGVNPSAIFHRLEAGWSIEQALTVPKPERPNAKLNMRQAREIRASYPKLNSVRLAEKYAVSKKTVLNILHGKIFIDQPPL